MAQWLNDPGCGAVLRHDASLIRSSRSPVVFAGEAPVLKQQRSQKHSGLVPVDYTLKKHVRKPRGAAPGSADYHHETTLHVTP